MTLKELQEEQSPIIFPDGQPENLIRAHDAFYQEGLWTLNKWVDCYRGNHSDVYDHCATYFNCGMTVFPMVPGSISKIYVIDRVNAETGEEDPTAKADWCCKVSYDQVEYHHIDRYVRLYQAPTTSSSSSATTDAILSSLFGVFRRKRRYPIPTDEGMEALPPLPGGFHYPQTSTDAPGRASGGVWAIHHGRLYLAPWIQSTETVVIEWSGVKSKWSPNDLIEDDIKFKEALRLFVQWKHETHYGEPQKATDFKDQLFGNPGEAIPGALPEIIHECREQTRIRTQQSSRGSAARGIGTGVQGGDFVNDIAGKYTATCPPGLYGDPKTVTVAKGTVHSPYSVADANARAQAQAQTEAQAALVCVGDPPEGLVPCDRQTWTEVCPAAHDGWPAAEGSAVNVVIEAGDPRFDRDTKAEANADALAFAKQLALQSLVCTFWNKELTETPVCPATTTGTCDEVKVEAHKFSANSQPGADALAAAELTKLVAQEISEECVGNFVTVENVAANCFINATCRDINGTPIFINVTGHCPASTFFRPVANNADAIAAGQRLVNDQAKTLALNEVNHAFFVARAQCRSGLIVQSQGCT